MALNVKLVVLQFKIAQPALSQIRHLLLLVQLVILDILWIQVLAMLVYLTAIHVQNQQCVILALQTISWIVLNNVA